MRSVLGIDAAWTEKQPSGIALATETSDGWILAVAEPSYRRFHARANPALVAEAPPSGSEPDASFLLASCRSICHHRPVLVAIDMPLSHSAITGRRRADTEVSRAYGSRKCATHSPSEVRPGALSDRLRKGFEEEGYPLLTTAIDCVGLIEVYPHPALLVLTNSRERLPYKVSKKRKYWPADPPAARRAKLFEQWQMILAGLRRELSGVDRELVLPDIAAGGVDLKAFEDTLDAVVCAWVGIYALNGKARPFGDEDAAIWIPQPDGGTPSCSLVGG